MSVWTFWKQSILALAIITVVVGVITISIVGNNNVNRWSNGNTVNNQVKKEVENSTNISDEAISSFLSGIHNGWKVTFSNWEVLETPTASTPANLDLKSKFKYLDSLTKTYKEDTLGDLLWKYKYNIVYFYPKDWTPNCTIQALDFSRLQEEFNKQWIGIIGVSKDNIESHKLFADRNELKIRLLEDDKSILLSAYGALWEMKEYGNWSDKTDIERSTFLVDNTWKLIASFRNVKAIGHAERVLSVSEIFTTTGR